jgi:hypothetical protein
MLSAPSAVHPKPNTGTDEQTPVVNMAPPVSRVRAEHAVDPRFVDVGEVSGDGTTTIVLLTMTQARRARRWS